MYFFKNVETNAIVSGSTSFCPNGFLALACESIIDPADVNYLTTELVPAIEPVDAYYSKDGQANSPIQPMIADSSWEHVAAIPEHWSKDGEADVYVDPQDMLWTYYPAVAEYWTKDAESVFVQPMIADDSWTYHAAIIAVPAYERVIVDASVKATAEANAFKEYGISMALKAMDFGKRVIALFGFRTDMKNLSAEQIVTLNATFGPIKTLLETGSMGTAKDQIEAITPDGTLITADDITAILFEINSFLGV